MSILNKVKNNFITKDKFKIILYCFLVSFIILLFTSKCSFLYPFNDWVDANAFFTMGKSMINGVVPYRDLFEQKGLLLYLIYGIGYLISNTTFLGIFILEILFWTVALYYIYKIILLFLNKTYAYIIIPLFMVIICTSRAFTHGGSAEEFCLPLFMITLYYFLAHFKVKEITPKRLFIAGIYAGSVLLIKYTLLGFWFSFMALIFFNLIFNKSYKKAFISCMYFLGGMALPIVIALIYLGIHGAIGDFIRVYFIINLTSYSNEASNIFMKVLNIYTGFIGSSYQNGFVVLPLLVLYPFFVCLIDLKKDAKIYLVIIYLFTIFTVFFGLRFYGYYLFPILTFMLISIIALISKLSRYINIKFPKISILITFMISFLVAYTCANYKEMRFMKKEDLFQYKFANIISKEKNPTLVNMGFLDAGVYTTTGIVPTTYYFEKQNISYDRFPDNVDAFSEYIKNKKTDFIVYYTKYELDKLSQKELDLFQNYDLISSERQKFENKDYKAYLFKKKEV